MDNQIIPRYKIYAEVVIIIRDKKLKKAGLIDINNISDKALNFLHYYLVRRPKNHEKP